MQRFRNAWEFLRTSFWFVPLLMAVAAVGLVLLTMMIERRLLRIGPDVAWFIYVGRPEDAQDVLSTILSSMITMASLVFSITMVVLTLAASQFGPRLIRSFMSNPQTQVVLGTFVMTIIYCLLTLPSLDLREAEGKLPFLSVSIGVALTVVSVVLLVLFLHSLARSIVSETVIERVGTELDGILDEFPPLVPDEPQEPHPEKVQPADFDERAAFFGPARAGYVQAIQFDELVGLAEAADVAIALYFRAGHYVVPGGGEIAVYPGERADEALVVGVRRAILIGTHRTPLQDPDFSIRHLDEIAARALSPGVNDPYTAVAVIDRLSASLCRLMGRALPPGVHRGRDGAVRVAYTEASYAGLLSNSFNLIRQYGADTPIVVLHLLEAIGRIAEHVRLPAQHAALTTQAQAIMEAARRRIEEGIDRRIIEERYRGVERSLERVGRAVNGPPERREREAAEAAVA